MELTMQRKSISKQAIKMIGNTGETSRKYLQEAKVIKLKFLEEAKLIKLKSIQEEKLILEEEKLIKLKMLLRDKEKSLQGEQVPDSAKWVESEVKLDGAVSVKDRRLFRLDASYLKG
eukprot:356796-Hanusia_phi.AAC.1